MMMLHIRKQERKEKEKEKQRAKSRSYLNKYGEKSNQELHSRFKLSDRINQQVERSESMKQCSKKVDLNSTLFAKYKKFYNSRPKNEDKTGPSPWILV